MDNIVVLIGLSHKPASDSIPFHRWRHNMMMLLNTFIYILPIIINSRKLNVSKRPWELNYFTFFLEKVYVSFPTVKFSPCKICKLLFDLFEKVNSKTWSNPCHRKNDLRLSQTFGWFLQSGDDCAPMAWFNFFKNSIGIVVLEQKVWGSQYCWRPTNWHCQ